MKFVGFLTALAVLAGRALSMTQTEALAAAVKLYPQCALVCMASLIPKSECTLTDINCLCTNVPLNTNLTGCVMEKCNKYEALRTKNGSMTMCGGPVRDDSLRPLAIGLVFGFLALLAFLLRMCSVLPCIGRPIGWDDYMIILTVVLAVPPTVFAVPLTANGLGKDMWTLTPKNIENVLFYYYIGELFYFAAITANKLSILLFISRVFPDWEFRKLIFGAAGLCVSYGLAFIFATMFQCWPISYSWMQLNQHWEGRCNNVHLQAWASAFFNILVDIVVLALPLKKLWGVQLPLNKKLMLTVMFSFGIFVTIISVIRLRSLIVFANSQNITWDYSDAAWWSTLEIHIGIICASLPALRALFVTVGGKILSTAKGSSNGTGNSHPTDNSATLANSASSTVGKDKASTSNKPKHRDESDFIPLVEASEKGHFGSRLDVTQQDRDYSDEERTLRSRDGGYGDRRK